MRSVTLTITLALLIAAIGFLVYETWALAALAGRHEIAAREATGAAREAAAEARRIGQELQLESAARAAGVAEIDRLERELARGAAQLSAMADVVEQAQEGAAARVAAAREADRRALMAMPEGVRQCLGALHRGLRAEGYGSVRFLRAQSLDEEGLHGVEAIQTHSDGLGADLVVAGTMQAALDRAERRLVFTFFDGMRTQSGERVELPEAGWSIVFQPVDGRLLEQHLPYLIEAKGVYPQEPSSANADLPGDVDVATRMAWLERFDRLLEAAGTAETIQVQRFRGIEDGMFLGAQLLATDDKGRVEFGASCRRLAVEVDRTANVVSLVLRDGILRRGEAESTITDVGYRMLLPDVKPESAIEIMLGMVVTK